MSTTRIPLDQDEEFHRWIEGKDCLVPLDDSGPQWTEAQLEKAELRFWVAVTVAVVMSVSYLSLLVWG